MHELEHQAMVLALVTYHVSLRCPSAIAEPEMRSGGYSGRRAAPQGRELCKSGIFA